MKKQVEVEFLANCAEDRAGEIKLIDPKRAVRLRRAGYVRILEAPETAAVAAPEHAMAAPAENRVRAKAATR